MLSYKKIAYAMIGALGFASVASAEEVTFTVHHFLPPKANVHTKMIKGWADRVHKQSEGRLSFQIFPAMSMGGKPPEIYSQVRDGVVDIGWAVLGFTPGVFPRTEVFELPLVHAGSAKATTIALNASMDKVKDDFKKVHVLFLHAHDGNVLHSATKNVNSFEAAAGLKLRTPSRTGAWVIEAMGAEPVGMPIPALPEAMAKGVVDGALTTYEIAPALKLNELDKFVTELPNGGRLGTAVFMLAMNKDRYNELPDDLKKIIDANSGVNVAPEIGQMWEDFEIPGKQALEQSGVGITVLSEEEGAKFDKANEQVVERWIKEVSKKGIDGEGLVKAAREAIAKASK